jgi:hypothetical protein
MKRVSCKYNIRIFNIDDFESKDFKDRIENVHMESCYMIEPTCKFDDINCPANPFYTCNQ